MNRPGRQDGFTLLEVLVALAVLALLGASLVETERLAAAGSGRADARARAMATAASLLAEREARARSDGSGRLGDAGTFRITSRRRSDLVRPGAPVQPVELIVEVRLPRAAPVRLANLDWVDAAAR